MAITVLFQMNIWHCKDAPVHQVVQYEPAHTDAINCVVSLTPDLCVSGGHDQVSWRSVE